MSSYVIDEYYILIIKALIFMKGIWGALNKRRNRLHIVSEILEIAKEGSLKTQIMYKANLSFAQLNEYLSFLLKLKLLNTSVISGRTTYKTTPKGIQYIQSYQQISDLLINGEHHEIDLGSSPHR